MLLRLLTELQGIGLNTLGLRLAALLQAQGFLANLLQFQQALLAGLLVLLSQLTLELNRLLIELLAPLQGLLLQLLTPLTELLLQLGQAGLLLLFSLGHLLAGLADHLLALLTGLVAQFRHLPFGLLTHGLAVDQLLPLFDGVLLIHQTTAAEGNPGAIEHDLLELVELIQHGAHLGAELSLGHHSDAGDD